MILYDQHLHSHHSGDSDAPMDEQIRAAIKAGLSGITFTDHYDPEYPYELAVDFDGSFELDPAPYRREYEAMCARYGESLELGLGIELGLQPQVIPTLQNFLQDHGPFDLVIGSTHVCPTGDPYYPSFYEGRTEKEAFEEYFRSELENIRLFKDFDTLGHLDYVKRYGADRDQSFHYGDYADLIDEILRELIRGDKALEINTSAWYSGCVNCNPSPEILSRYRELGGTLLTVGADAHFPSRVGENFDRVVAMLKSLGFKSYAVYKKRQPIELPL